MPSSTLGLLWPSIRAGFHQPIAVLGGLLVFSTIASVIASVGTGRLLSRFSAGPLLVSATASTAVALEAEALAPSLWLFTGGMMLFGIGIGTIEASLNAHAAQHFGARQINWMHASYGAGAAVGPMLAAALLGNAVTWRWIYAAMGIAQALLALVFTLSRHAWAAPVCTTTALAAPAAVAAPAAPQEHQHQHQRPRPRRRQRPRPRQLRAQRMPWPRCSAQRRTPRRWTPAKAVLGSAVFTTVESGIEAGAGTWGYVFLTDGRGQTGAVAGVAVSGYWAMMFLGRVVLGALAERIGPHRVLGAAVAGVSVGCALMAVPGPGVQGISGLMVVGLAAAPIFPLFTLTTAQRIDADDFHKTTQTVGLQVASSAIGSAALPAGIGLAIGAFTAKAMAAPLLLLSLTMCVLYGLLSRSARSGSRSCARQRRRSAQGRKLAR